LPRYRQPLTFTAARIRRIRATAELSQSELAELAHVDVRTVKRWELAGATLDGSTSYIRNSPAGCLLRLEKRGRPLREEQLELVPRAPRGRRR
jgi:hypothetical protein